MELSLGAKFKQIDTVLSRQANEQLAHVDLTLAQISVIDLLMHAHHRQMSQKEIEKALGVSHPTTTGLVKRLEAKGLVESRRSETDARMKNVRLTDAGIEAYAKGSTSRDDTDRQLAAGFTKAELEQLSGYLDRVIDNLT